MSTLARCLTRISNFSSPKLVVRSFSRNSIYCTTNTDKANSTNWEFFNQPSLQEKPKRIIQDIIEQQWNPMPEILEEPDPEFQKVYNLERGKTGVFDLDELLELIKEKHGMDICVIAIPKEMEYADHMVIVTAISVKHMHALATFIRKRFKSKHLLTSDVIPKIEGTKQSEDWLALDLGNTILHVFCKETRDFYDLETLWTVGSNYDDLSNQKDSEIVTLLNLFK